MSSSGSSSYAGGLILNEMFSMYFRRALDGGGGEEDHGDEHGFGVHISFEDLYASIIFLGAIYIAGKIASGFLSMPALVGEIVAGVLLGPGLLEYVPNAEAFVMLGEIGLILLVVEAGIDIDLTTLKLIGLRGVTIAIVGSLLPIAFAIAIAFALGTDSKGAIAGGCAFGPTSLGIAMNILRTAKIINTPVGQMIVAAAVIDDMIALIILSQLNSLTGDITATGILIPVISALCFLCIGGYVAIFVLPDLVDKFILSKVKDSQKGILSMALMFGLVAGLLPATYYTEASYLMGAFVAGLAFCSNHDAHIMFVSQFKRVMQWLIRIFFAASIGFQVPIKDFGDGKVIGYGLIFTLALLGKLAVGFMVPNFTQNRRFTGNHLRDCLVVGFSMAAEGEFAFVIAVFAVDSGLIEKDLYASIVLAVLLSTILSPFSLRYTINKYAKATEKAIKDAEEIEKGRNMELGSAAGDMEQNLSINIGKTTVFLCIQTQSDSGWGLLPRIMGAMGKLQLEVIDHRSWNPRGINTTLVNEIYAKDSILIQAAGEDGEDEALQNRLEEVQAKILEVIDQPAAKVKVHRWFPGVIEEIFEETTEDENGVVRTTTKKCIRESILEEAQQKLEEKKSKQLAATQARPLEEILKDKEEIPGATNLQHETSAPELPPANGSASSTLVSTTVAPRRSRRVRTRSTPVVGGDLFASNDVAQVPVEPTPEPKVELMEKIAEETDTVEPLPQIASPPPRRRRIKTRSTPAVGGDMFGAGASVTTLTADIPTTRPGVPPSSSFSGGFGGSARRTDFSDRSAELIVNGEVYNVKLSPAALERIIEDATSSHSRVTHSHARITPHDLRFDRLGRERETPFEDMLGGFIRKDDF